MKCPNCGAELKEGTFYCESCGHDIHIVPDFEPELELNLERSLDQIREDVGEPEIQDDEGDWTDSGGKRKPFRRVARWCGYFFLSLLVFGLVFGGIRTYQYYSAEYQVSRAVQAVADAQYDKAVRYYTRAMELDKNNVELKFDLAEVYFLKNNEVEYENLLTDIIHDPYTDAEQLESAYGKLIAIYKARGDYQTISDILKSCDNESIKAAYQGYLAQTPEFSVASGTYDSMTALKLTVTGKGVIYYTVNGEDPDESSERYTAPILLENGHYTVKAFFVNENGVAGEIVSAEYLIEAEELEAPEINVDSGDYSSAVFITVLGGLENIYYTTDGSEPTIDSQQYTGPIPMPLGPSFYRFVRLEAGKSSAVVDRTFNFVLQTDFSAEQAVAKVLEYNLQSGKIVDEAGHFDDTGAYYQYQYLYVVNIDQISDFYVIAEVLVDSQGVPARTGKYFAVNAYTGYYYRLQIENGIYRLTEL